MAAMLRQGLGQAGANMRSVPIPVIVLAFLGLLLAVQLVRLFWVIATPVDPTRKWTAPMAEIIPANTRKLLFGSFDPFLRESSSNAASTITSLNLKLFGIRSNESSGGGSAIIAGEDGVQNSFAVGEEVIPGVTLDSVAFDYVVLSRGGVKESLYIDQSVPAETVGTGVAPAGETPLPAPAAPGGAINAESLQKSVGFATRSGSSGVTGLVLSAKDDGSVLRAAGFQPGDIVVAINGRPVTSANDIASQLRPGARLSVEVERGAQKVPVALILEQ